MQSVLKVEIKHQILNDFIVRIIKKFLDDECTNNNIYRCIRSGGFITILNRKTLFIYRGKNLIGEDFAQESSNAFLSRSVRFIKLSSNDNCWQSFVLKDIRGTTFQK